MKFGSLRGHIPHFILSVLGEVVGLYDRLLGRLRRPRLRCGRLRRPRAWLPRGLVGRREQRIGPALAAALPFFEI